MLSTPSSLASVVAEARVAMGRFPGSLLASVTSGGLGAYLIHQEESWLKVGPAALTIALGIPLFLALDLAVERSSRIPGHAARAVAYSVGLAALAIHFWLTRGDTTVNYAVRYLQLSLATHLVVAFAAFVGRNEENGFWQFNRHLFLRFLESGLYASVFYVGVSLAALASNYLFDIKVPGTFYARLWIFAVFVLLTWRFLAVVPRTLSALQQDEHYPRGLRLFIQYLLVPLATLYGLILYAYLGKIVVLWSLAKGEVGWLVSAASVFGMFTLLMLYPAAGATGPRWARTYARLFWPAIIPLLGMLFVALWVRVRQYGVTERRYFLAALAVWLLVVAVYFVATRRPRIIAVPVTLAFVALITLVGPWGAYAVSLRSQQARLDGLLARHGLWREGRIEKSSGVVNWDDRREISRILDYLYQFHGAAALSRWFGTAPALAKDTVSSERSRRSERPTERLMAEMGLPYVNPYDSSRELRFERYGQGETVEIAGYDYMVELRISTDSTTFALDGRDYTASLNASTASFELRRGSELVLAQPLGPLLERLASGGSATPSSDAMTIAWESQEFRAKLVLRSLRAKRLPDGRIEPTYWVAVLLLRRR